MTTQYLLSDIAEEEGLSLEAYPDPLSPLGYVCAQAGLKPQDYLKLPGWRRLSGAPWTIGYGTTGPGITAGTTWTQGQADNARRSRVSDICARFSVSIPWWRGLSDVRQDVLVQMAYQMGVDGLLQFKDMLADARAGDFAASAAAMGDSVWAKQTTDRERRLAKQWLTDARAA